MNTAPHLVFTWSHWWELIQHLLALSVASVGGPLGMASEMHRYFVTQQHWLTDGQFNASVVIAQAAPGPNVLFVALLGWNIGMNAGGYLIGLATALLCLVSILLPCCIMIFFAAKWIAANQALRAVKAFKQGMSPVVISMLIASGWLLATSNADKLTDWPLWLTTAITTLLVLRSRINMFWLLAIGATLGAVGVLN